MSYYRLEKNESQGKIRETHLTTTFYLPYRHSLPNSTARRTNLTPCLSLNYPNSQEVVAAQERPGCETEGTRPGGPVRGLALSTELAFSGS
ncbi:hypothetical protein IFM47457_04481 [Aspergillus lentulus]|nr:hypothetical protein IFM47457_04481 [Aspergillus lentulus]